MIDFMEQNKPNNEHMSWSDKQFYRDWIQDILMRVPGEVAELKKLRARFDISVDLDVDLEMRTIIGENTDIGESIQNVINKIQQEIDERLAGTVESLQRNVFEPGLFPVTIVVEGYPVRVESMIVEDEQVVPVVDGTVYSGPVDEVVFDR